MKKTIFAVALAALALTACNSKNCCKDNACASDKQEIYSGILPGADTDGILYTLNVDYDEDDNCLEGDYNLVQTYLAADSVAPTGYKDVKTVRSEGDFKVESKKVDGAEVKYLRLIPDMKDSSPEADSQPMYFVVSSDSTLTMVNSDLKPSENAALNYTLVKK